MSVPCLCKDFDMRPVRRSRLLCTLGVCIAIMFLLVPTSRVFLRSEQCNSVGVNVRNHLIPVASRNSSKTDVSGLWQEIGEDMLRLSEHPDIGIRGKFQKQRIRVLCRTHLFSREQHFPSEPSEAKRFHRHLIYEEHTRSMYCFVPKEQVLSARDDVLLPDFTSMAEQSSRGIGCTNMKRLMLYMGGHLPTETIDWPWVDDTKYLEPALKHASLMNKTLTKSHRMRMIHNYYKFMAVRNPLERLLSSYRNKIEPPIDHEKQDSFPHMIKKLILQRYRLQEYVHWQGAPKSTRRDLNVTFSDFIKYVIETTSEELNEHIRPSIDICHPCLVHYDFYPNFKTISPDSQALIKKFRTNPRFYRDESLHIQDSNTSQLLHHYYSQLSHWEKVKLLGAWYDELVFYYALYPSERRSHKTLLGVDHPVL